MEKIFLKKDFRLDTNILKAPAASAGPADSRTGLRFFFGMGPDLAV
jgi:hypothetical protein